MLDPLSDLFPIARRLARRLRVDDVEGFFLIYDDIPSSVTPEDTEAIKETARELAEDGVGLGSDTEPDPDDIAMSSRDVLHELARVDAALAASGEHERWPLRFPAARSRIASPTGEPASGEGNGGDTASESGRSSQCGDDWSAASTRGKSVLHCDEFERALYARPPALAGAGGSGNASAGAGTFVAVDGSDAWSQARSEDNGSSVDFEASSQLRRLLSLDSPPRMRPGDDAMRLACEFLAERYQVALADPECLLIGYD